MNQPLDFWSMLFVFVLASFIGVGVIRRVSRLLHTPLMSITNAISAIAVDGFRLARRTYHPAEPTGRPRKAQHRSWRPWVQYFIHQAATNLWF